MITEGIIIASAIYFIFNWDKLKIKRRWKDITFSNNKFTNKLGKTLKILDIEYTEYGYKLTIELPYSYTVENLEKDIDIFREGLHLKSIQIESKNNVVYMRCVDFYEFKDYEGIKLPPNELLIADGFVGAIKVNMNNFPHMLIGGDTGTGKSRLLLLMLTNLIKYNSNVNIHLLQLRKNDLGVFKNCRQVKTNSNSLEEVLECLEKIDKECIRRERIIDNTKGYYSIADYNNDKRNWKLNYIYVVIEEFSFLNISKGDTKEEKALKSRCLKHIKTIVNVGRSSGVFLITALQKPTNDSIPSDIKAQLTTRISLLIKDAPAARVILGNENNTKLENREVIVRTLEEVKGYSYTINHDLIIENIKNRIVNKDTTVKKKVDNKKENKKSILEVITNHEIN